MHQELTVRQDIRNSFGGNVYYIPETGSTMADAAQLSEEGIPSGSVILTSFQKIGRGRITGRVWTASPGENLLFTLYLDNSSLSFPLSRLPLLTGLALSCYLDESFALRSRVKWPNDVLIDGRKVAGILCEAVRGRVYIGVGLNCNQKTFPPELERKAVSLRCLTGRDVDLNTTLTGFLSVLQDTFSDAGTESSAWKQSLESRLYRKGERVSLLTGLPDQPRKVSGTLVGIAEDGGLLLLPEFGSSPLCLYSGEISFE